MAGKIYCGAAVGTGTAKVGTGTGALTDAATGGRTGDATGLGLGPEAMVNVSDKVGPSTLLDIVVALTVWVP